MQIMILTKTSFVCFSLFIVFFLFGCDNKLESMDDLAKARIEIQNHKWIEAERLLSRYLKEQEDSVLRWEAWNELITIINRIGSEPLITLEYLNAMLYEFEADKKKYKNILYQIGLLNEDLWLYDRAADVWLSYINIDDLSGEEIVNVHMRLAKIYYLNKHFESAEDILNNCLALDVAPNKLAYCMYDLAELNIVQERWEEVSDLAIQILDMKVDNKIKSLTLFLLADSLEQQGKFQDSLSYFEQCIDIYPNMAVVIRRIEYLQQKIK